MWSEEVDAVFKHIVLLGVVWMDSLKRKGHLDGFPYWKKVNWDIHLFILTTYLVIRYAVLLFLA